jgi:endonuclease/exonuclease/phosphatase family metal-dependent hydrolase
LASTGFFLAPHSQAQILFSAGTYRQDFDSLATNGTSNAWSDNVTLAGWYASKSSGAAAFTSYIAGSGSDFSGAIYSFGNSGSTERAFGSICSGTAGNIAYGVRFTNDTSFAQTNITISYTGEQWRNANGSGAVTNVLSFSYRVSNLPITSSDVNNQLGWTSVDALNFNSPIVNPGGAGTALNGNVAANQIVFTNVVLSGVVVQPGEELFLRWRDIDDTSSDAGLALDNLTVTFEGIAASTSPPGTNTSFSLLTYNVKGNGATDWSTNAPQVRAIGRQLQYLQPNIITFQEIPYDLSYEMTNFVNVYLPGYSLARNSGTDGSIRSMIVSRFPITRSTSWLDGIDLRSFGYSNANNNLDNFTRDLFEAQISVPNFPQPLHVFTVHLKANGTNYADSAAKRAAEAAAITNFFATNFFVLYPLHPYLLSGDMNEANTNTLAIQRLLSAQTGLQLTNPKNPYSGSINTFSIQGSLSERIDYIFPGAVLFSNIQASQVFRTDVLNPLPPNLNASDDSTASDHLPVLMVFNNPYAKLFNITSVSRSNQTVTLTWNSVPGQLYRIEASSNLIAWTAMASNLLATNSFFSFATNVSPPQQFLRVRQGP